VIVFWDESGVIAAGDPPDLGAARGHPVIGHRFKRKRASMPAALCYGSRGGGAQLAFHSKVVRAWLRCQRSWLLVEPLPGYAPDLNPVQPQGRAGSKSVSTSVQIAPAGGVRFSVGFRYMPRRRMSLALRAPSFLRDVGFIRVQFGPRVARGSAWAAAVAARGGSEDDRPGLRKPNPHTRRPCQR
jgi:hypothetical protein